jgi:hypothetical protein
MVKLVFAQSPCFSLFIMWTIEYQVLYPPNKLVIRQQESVEITFDLLLSSVKVFKNAH